MVFTNLLIGQKTYGAELQKENPIQNDKEYTLEERLEIHQKYLNTALASRNQDKIFLGYTFLISDYMRGQDYVRASEILILADSVAEASKNKNWQGHVLHRKAIMAMRLDNKDEAINHYYKSIKACAQGGDSLCIGEAYEQLGLLYGRKMDFVKSDSLYKIGIEILKKHGFEKQIATSYNNRAIILNFMGKPYESIKLYEMAVASFNHLNMNKEMLKAMNNLADGYRNVGNYDKALSTLDECIETNKKENLSENLYINYANISEVYAAMGRYKLSLEYLKLYYNLKDSLTGLETKTKIASITNSNEIKIKEQQLEQAELSLRKEKEVGQLKTILFLVLLLFSTIMAIFLYKRIASHRNNIRINEHLMEGLTMKNNENTSKIFELETAIVDFKNMIYQKEGATDVANARNVYNAILTNEDWIAFKAYFINRHPDYIARLRDTFPKITEAEERLFLLVKLNLHTKEIASILGIDVQSVKKTRARLRKKLGIEEDVALDVFIHGF